MKVDLMELRINADRRSKILSLVAARLAVHQKTFIVTPYSEFFYHAAHSFEFERAVNSATFALADGVSVPWLAYYLSLPLTAQSYTGKIWQAVWQALVTLPFILLNPKKIYSIIPEKIPGSDFFWDLVQLADERHLKIFLLGGFGDVPKIVGEKITAKFKNVEICGYSNRGPDSTSEAIVQINAAAPDILMVAYGPVAQELWIQRNLVNLNCTLAIGLGGTFDYVAGLKSEPPAWVRSVGLEWLYRLVTQPTRARRIWRATGELVLGAVREKVFRSLPLRENVSGVIINKRGEVFVAQRAGSDSSGQFPQGAVDAGETKEHAILREMREETGSSSYQILGIGKRGFEYNWRHFYRPLFGNTKRARGQRQTVFFLKYTAEQDDFAIDGREIGAYRWVPLHQLPKFLGSVRQKMYQQCVEPEIHHYVNIAMSHD
jgi:N-acetylglucosaminyldiphosphoundecaprenol N-acetyl-beta-D-mannosaminyltransferase